MTWLTWIFIATTLIFFGLALFLGKEMFKKFRFMKQFVGRSASLLEFDFQGVREHGWKRGMRNIVIRWDKSFSVLVGFELTIPIFGTGFDYYGQTDARKEGDEWVAVISTYLGRGPCRFQFFLNREKGINYIGHPYPSVSSYDTDQTLAPSAVYPPHFFQRLGFYA
ncbi:MAG: hypothetical protein PHD72_04445 [Patescibacteria group bacterium]|nr:hypothetical protein [Patescibacteria group bacterium]